MREILFRGKRNDNSEWVEGTFDKSENGVILASDIPNFVKEMTEVKDNVKAQNQV